MAGSDSGSDSLCFCNTLGDLCEVLGMKRSLAVDIFSDNWHDYYLSSTVLFRKATAFIVLKIRQCPLLAPSVRGPQMVWECVCVCVCVCARARAMKYALRWHITISVHSLLCQCQKHTHTRIHKPFEDSEPTGLIVDIAKELKDYATVVLSLFTNVLFISKI